MASKNAVRRKKKIGINDAFGILEEFAKKSRLNAPHLHVSDPIPDDDTLKAGLAGTYNVYARFAGHPDVVRLENWLCGVEGGAKFRVYASGMAAITTALFATGEINGPVHIIAVLPLYGGTYALLRKLARSPAHNFLVTFVYANEPDFIRKLYDAIGPATRAIIFEVAGNPTLTIPPVEEIVCVANKCVRRIITICDNTFHFGLFKPLKWGVDVVVGSGTKYLVGESSWLMGYLGVSKSFADEYPQFWSEVTEWSTELGATFAPIEAWLTGDFCTETLMHRVVQQSINARYVAYFLEAHPSVERVLYPGLKSHPQHENAMRYLEPVDQLMRFGGMISFYLKDADFTRTMRFLYYLNNHTHIKFKASLGGPVDSVESPLALSHAVCDAYDNFRCGITNNNIRLSIGHLVSNSSLTIAALDETLHAINSPH